MNQAAETRFSNDQARAKRALMVGNPAAQQAIRNTYNKKNPGAPAQQPVDSGMGMGMPQAPVGQGQDFQQPQGGPQVPPMEEENSDLDAVVGEMRFQHFLDSPRTKDAMESVKLKELFNRFNTDRRIDRRSILDKIISRIGVPDE